MISEKLKKQLSIAYDSQSNHRNDAETQTWKIYERSSFLQRLINEEKNSLLEIGAGAGKDSDYFKTANLNVHATDLSEQMVEKCREKGLNASVMSFDELTFEKDSFDAVWSLNCLLHVPKNNLRDVLKGVQHVLKTDGLFYMGVYGGINQEGIWENDFHEPKRFFSFYQDEDLETVLEQYFTIEAFHKIPMSHVGNGPTHFQGFILRK
ncbi:class I SAM-dependent methyltransferase [Halobacillus litoralis]|uniref:Class I SAM-dependent methyltransferase n=1 Tax=Halobacillus litoralis TaxID=45668 RepID=A0A410MAP3_9BACI|nr:class I SAM-dependent methyltransferase [Halobacillus litoralis]QAS51748.1 class I SAM-dependent methyltransferase [Halobacillus litoralis]